MYYDQLISEHIFLENSFPKVIQIHNSSAKHAHYSTTLLHNSRLNYYLNNFSFEKTWPDSKVSKDSMISFEMS